ncbi:MAG TPA: hypothetical protein VER33_20020 [Polyangiaceae bacterium]|nr:hypothetical protein [Polyangiaceae bacterium]
MPYCFRPLFGCLFLSFVAAGCGDGGSDEEAPARVDPIGLRIVSVSTTSGVAWTPETPVPLPLGCDGRLVLDVAIEGTFTVRPPGWCGRLPACGHVRVRAEPATGAATQLEFSARLGLLELGSTWSGLTALHAELATGDGDVYLNADASAAAADPVSIEVLSAPADCSAGAPEMRPDDAAPNAGNDDSQG